MTEPLPPNDDEGPPEIETDLDAAADGPEMAEADTVGRSLEDSITEEDLLAAATDLSEQSAEPHDPVSYEPPYEPPYEPAPAGAATDGATPPPPPYEPAPVVAGSNARRLFRSRSDRKIGGVAAGLARYLGVDPTVVRIVFVILALTGTSILIYLAAWILIPQHPAGEPEPVWHPRETDRNLAIAVGLASIGLAVAILNESWLLLALVLIAGGIWLLSEQPKLRPPLSDESAPNTTPPADRAPQMGRVGEPAMAGATGTAGTASHPPVDPAASTGWAWETPPPPPGPSQPASSASPAEPQRISRIVLSLLALLIGLGIAAGVGDWWDVSGTRLLGIAIVIIGTGVVAGAIRGGQARGMIPLGIIAVFALVPTIAIEDLSTDGIGEVSHRPTTLAQLESEYRHGVGELTVDLRELDLDGTTQTIEIDLGIGEVEVFVPAEVGGIARMEAIAGELSIDLPGASDDRSDEGIDVEITRITLPGDRGTLDLDIEVGLGVAELRAG
ncbi:MAG: PspC domain-containing protein [Actinomycetota bacterium]